GRPPPLTPPAPRRALPDPLHRPHGDRPMSRPHPGAARDKFARARTELPAALIERDQEVDLVLTALVAREHVLLVGPPGCAKSLLLEAVMRWLGGTTFTCLLTRFTTPEELYGPVSV